MARVTVNEKLTAIVASAEVLEPLDMPVRESLGSVLAEDVATIHPVPSFDQAAWDGYAMAQVPEPGTVLDVVDEVRPGFQADVPVTDSATIRVYRGAWIPSGTTVVLPDSHLTASTGSSETDPNDDGSDTISAGVQVSAAPDVLAGIQPGYGIVGIGDVAAVGQVVVRSSDTITERHIAALTAAGRSRVRVHPRPRVVVIRAGYGIVAGGSGEGDGLVPDASGAALVAACQASGVIAFSAGVCPETVESISEAVEEQIARADLIVVLAPLGADPATGAAQVVAAALAPLGDVQFWDVAAYPSPSLGFGTVGSRVPLFVLPADDGSALLDFEVFVRPMLRAMAGRSDLYRPVVRARLTTAAPSQPGVRSFLPATVSLPEASEDAEVRVVGPSATVIDLPIVNAIVMVDEASGTLQAGDEVAVIRLDRG